MKNLRIVSEGNENVSVIDTFLLEKLLIVYRNSLVSTSSSQIVGEHIDNLRKNINDMSEVVKLNHEFNMIQMFNRGLTIGIDNFAENKVDDSSDKENFE